MTLRPLPRSRLTTLIPPLVESQALVALVPVTGDLRWAAETAWLVARAAATPDAAAGGAPRAVTLVDLWIEDPRLHEIVGLTPSDGIVDAFEYEVSLTKAAHQVDPIYFIGAGSSSANPAAFYAHPRWSKLHAGFRAEGALLLLYVSPSGLARLSATADGVLLLAPEGFALESDATPGIAAAMERGIPMLGVVRERWSGAMPVRASPPVVRRPSGALPFAPRARPWRRVTAVAGALLVVAVAATAAVRFVRPTAPAHMPPAGGSIPSAAAAAPVVPPAGPARYSAPPWTVQLAAYGSRESALEHADAITAAGRTAIVTPVMLSPSGTIWYRVCEGLYATRDDARRGRTLLRRKGLTRTGEGIPLLAPYSLSLADTVEPGRLRELGLPAFRWTQDPRMLAGAFETPDQAAYAEAQLASAGRPAMLVARTGATP